MLRYLSFASKESLGYGAVAELLRSPGVLPIVTLKSTLCNILEHIVANNTKHLFAALNDQIDTIFAVGNQRMDLNKGLTFLNLIFGCP